MTTGSAQGRVAPHPEVLIQMLPGGDAVLLHMSTEVYFGLNPVGARIWEALVETGDVESAGRKLVGVFAVDEDRLLSDLDDLVGELVAAGLLERVES